MNPPPFACNCEVSPDGGNIAPKIKLSPSRANYLDLDLKQSQCFKGESALTRYPQTWLDRKAGCNYELQNTQQKQKTKQKVTQTLRQSVTLLCQQRQKVNKPLGYKPDYVTFLTEKFLLMCHFTQNSRDLVSFICRDTMIYLQLKRLPFLPEKNNKIKACKRNA